MNDNFNYYKLKMKRMINNNYYYDYLIFIKQKKIKTKYLFRKFINKK